MGKLKILLWFNFCMFIFTFQSLFEELVLNGIIKEYPKVPLKDFRGDISYTGGTLKLKKKGQKNKEPIPGGGDIRRAIVEYCILPMSKNKDFYQLPPYHGWLQYSIAPFPHFDP